MKRAIKLLLVSLAATTMLTACSKPPVEELSAAKAAFEAVVSAGAGVSHTEAMQSINTRYQEALDEVKAQEATIFGNYSMAIFTLNQVSDDSNELLNKIRTENGQPVVAYVKRGQPFVE